MARRLLPLLGVLLACGRGDSGKPQAVPLPRGDAGTGAAVTDSAAADPLVLGMPAAAGFAYRHRPGHAAYLRARSAASSSDWPAVIAACRDALSLDADHLDASYLLAIGLAHTGAPAEQILPRLGKAVGGDLGKWGHAVTVHPALRELWSTPVGRAWLARLEDARRRFVAVLARSLLVIGDGDVFAVDVGDARRWYRITRTHGSLVGALHARQANRLAYVTRSRRSGSDAPPTVGIGIVDLATGRMHAPLAIPGPPGPLRVAYNTKRRGFVVRAGKKWFAVGDVLTELPAKQAGYALDLADRAWLDIDGGRLGLTRLASPGIRADWDERTLASAIRIASTNRVVSAPSPGLIDGNTLAWSPDRSQLAFVAQLAEDCTAGQPATAAYIADVATGRVRELERAIDGNAVEWIADRTLAVAGDSGVMIESSEPATKLEGADALVTPRRRPRCDGDPPAPAATDVDVTQIDEPID